MKYDLDMNKIKWTDSKKGWKFCVGSGNAKLALQSDYQAQLKYVHEELGFKRVRFHGLFNDGLCVVREIDDIFNIQNTNSKIREYSFQQIAKVLDAVIETGVQPFIELGMMPRVLARDEVTLFKYKDYVSPPKEMEEWNELIKRFINFIIDRYGIEEVKEWYFEVWNEPDVKNFWSGTKEEYFELYKNTAITIKSICSDLMVGGPSTAKTRWIDEFYEYCSNNNVPVDFITTHQYPGDALGHSFDRSKHAEKVKNAVAKDSESILDVTRKILCNEEKIKSYPSNLLVNNAIRAKNEAKELPLYYTEWNTTSICVAPHNDTHMSAAYIVKTCLEADEIIDGSSFWTFSDIFEELAYFTDPFNGAFGLLTIDGIEKPSFYAFKFLNDLGDKKYTIKSSDDHIHISMYKKSDKIQIIITNHHFDMSDSSEEEYEFEFLNLGGISNIVEKRINETDSNSYSKWLNMGMPKPLKKLEVAEIRESARPKNYECNIIRYKNTIRLKGKIKSNETKLITLEINRKEENKDENE